jgi:23S rRNA pseudouridine1911/1915/1917 synthase
VTSGPSRRLEVSADEAGLRLDALLARRGLFASVAAARRAIAAGEVRVGGRRPRKGDRLQAGDGLEVATAAGPVVVPDASLPLVVLYTDEALVAVDKPAGMAAHPLRAGEGGTLASALVARFPECAAASPDPREAGLVHRLDVGTSGVLVAARSAELWPQLRRRLGGRGDEGDGGDEGGGDDGDEGDGAAADACEKTYLAEVAGGPPGGGAGVGAPVVVQAPIGRSGRRSGKVRVGAGRGLLPATTTVVWRAPALAGDAWLVEARLSRGRAHQVRAHLAHLGAPVVGDPRYGDPRAAALAAAHGVVGFRLHAWRLSFVHPLTGRRLLLEAPAPAWTLASIAPVAR